MSKLRSVVIALAIAVLYIGCAKLGLALAFRAAQVTAVWPATGFAIAAVFRYRWRAVPGVLLGAFIANATASEPLLVAMGIAIGNTLEAMVGAWILRRFSFNGRLARVRDVVVLLATVIAAPIVSATIGVTSLGLGNVQPVSSLPELWWIWWVGDALGGLVVAPVLLVWTERNVRVRGSLVEAALLHGGLTIACAVVFVRLPALGAAEFVVFPFLIWAALRFGPSGTATAALVASAIAIFGTEGGAGPFAGAGPEQGLVLLQIFLAVAAATGLILGAVSAQNRDAHERAELSENRLRLAMSAGRVGVWDWNIVTGQLMWSDELEPLHGLSRGSFPGTFVAFQRLVHPDDRARVDGAIRDAVDHGVPYELQFRVLGADGVVRWTDARAQVLRDEDGGPLRMVGVAMDITEAKTLEDELRQETRRRDEFLAMLGHELRNPLAPILHATEVLSDLQDTDRRHVEIIRRQSRHLARMVDDLLDVSRVTSGKVRLERRKVPLADVVASAVDMWKHAIARHRQELTIDLGPEPIWLDADPTRCTQVVANLLHNASKFTPEEGKINITARIEEKQAVLRVRDTGAGMTDEIRAHAFDLFVQGPRALDRPLGGLGIGLTLVRSLVEMHGGSVSAASEGGGKGTEVTVRLPIAAAPPVSDANVVAMRPKTSSRSKRILVVEDHDDARNVLMFMLQRDGHDVRGASDGASALTVAEELVPEIVLLDIGLPRMDGYAVAEKLRASPRCASAVLIALTGYGQPEDRDRSKAAGIDHHLLKPLEPATLMELIGRN